MLVKATRKKILHQPSFDPLVFIDQGLCLLNRLVDRGQHFCNLRLLNYLSRYSDNLLFVFTQLEVDYSGRLLLVFEDEAVPVELVQKVESAYPVYSERYSRW